MQKKLVAFSWYGGKTSHLNFLLPLINNTHHTSYDESYGGSAALLLNKKPSLVETYNDTYSDVVNFFRVLRDNNEELIRLLELTPYSREEFTIACNRDEKDSPLEQARKFYVIARQVRLGLATTASPGRWAFTKNESRNKKSLVVSRWLGGISLLNDIVIRLKNVQIENKKALYVLEKYDSVDALHYVDPPYLKEVRSGGKAYADEMTLEEHLELLSLLKTLKGKVILSGYNSDVYTNNLDGWTVLKSIEKIAPSTRIVEHGDKSDKIRQEVVWCNYKLKKNIDMFDGE